MRINHNISAINTYRQMGVNQTAATKNMEKLSSGLRINRAGDDAAGLAISEKMRGQIRGLDMAAKNSQDGISLIQTAEGALNETHSILQRMRELSVQAANDTNTDADRVELQKEVKELLSEVTRIGNNTEFNTKTLMNGDLAAKATGTIANATEVGSVSIAELGSLKDTDTFTIAQTVNYGTETTGGANDGALIDVEFEIELADGTKATGTLTKAQLDEGKTSVDVTGGDSKFTVKLDDAATLKDSSGNGVGTATATDTLTFDDNALSFQIGANANQTMRLDLNDMRSEALGIDGIDISTSAGAQTAITALDSAIQTVSAERSKMGANQNRLEHTINNVGASSENLTAAESRIRDVDMAKEMMEMTKNNILQQAAQAMLAQANQQPQGVLQLLR